MRFLLAPVVVIFAVGCGVPAAVAMEGTAVPSETASFDHGPVIQEAVRSLTSSADEVAPAGLTLPQQEPALPRPQPQVVRASQRLQCVPYAREVSGIDLRGDAWTWWTQAAGRYERGASPRPGGVLVLSKSRRLRLGHLAVVTEVVNSREIIVHQANWLNAGRIHQYTPVRDVSKNNDWSEVRVWYTPGQVYGARHYPAYGFIYPRPEGAEEIRQAAR
ncbi:MAG: CHAP domain-containing protein [Kiloniellaceae bacterium]